MTTNKLPYEMTEQERKQMSKRDWKINALRDLQFILKVKNQKEAGERVCRDDRDFAGYLERFYFGKGELTFDVSNCEEFKKRMADRDIPMPRNIYLYG